MKFAFWDEFFYHMNFCIFKYGVESWRRILLTNQRSELNKNSFEMRECMDLLSHSSGSFFGAEALIDYSNAKKELAFPSRNSLIPDRK
jgi:hypothetical protein